MKRGGWRVTVLLTLLSACGPTDAVLGWRDDAQAPPPEGCGRRFVLAEGEGLVLGRAHGSEASAVGFFDDGTDRSLAEVDGTTATVRRIVQREVVVAPALPLRDVLIFQNHRLLGQHNVFATPFAPAEPGVAWSEITRISDGVEEALAPRAAARGDRVGVAYRQGPSLRFAVLDAARNVVGAASLPGRLPNPGLRAVVPDADGFLVLVERSDWEIERFDPDGQHLGPGPRISAPAVALASTTEGRAAALSISSEGATYHVLETGQEVRRMPIVSSVPLMNVDLAGRGEMVAALLDADGLLTLVAMSAEGAERARARVTAEGEVATAVTTAHSGGQWVLFWTRSAPTPALLASVGCVPSP